MSKRKREEVGIEEQQGSGNEEQTPELKAKMSKSVSTGQEQKSAKPKDNGEGSAPEHEEESAEIAYIRNKPEKLRIKAASSSPIDWNATFEGHSLAYTFVKNVLIENIKDTTPGIKNPGKYEPDLWKSICRFSMFKAPTYFNFVSESKQEADTAPSILVLILMSHSGSLPCRMDWSTLLKKLEIYLFNFPWNKSEARLVAQIALSDANEDGTPTGLLLPILETLVLSPHNLIEEAAWNTRLADIIYWAQENRSILLNKLLAATPSTLQQLPWNSLSELTEDGVDDVDEKLIEMLASLFTKDIAPSTLTALAQLDNSVLETLRQALLPLRVYKGNVAFRFFLTFLLHLNSLYTPSSSSFDESKVDSALNKLKKDQDLYSKSCFCVAKKIEKQYPLKAEKYYLQIPKENVFSWVARTEIAHLYMTEPSRERDSKDNNPYKTELEKAKQQVFDLTRENSGLKTEVSSLKTEVSTLNTELNGLKTKVDALMSEVENLSKERAEASNSRPQSSSSSTPTLFPGTSSSRR